MGLDFIRNYGGCRLEQYDLQPPLLDEPTDDEPEQAPDRVDLNYEVQDRGIDWQPINVNHSAHWRASNWQERPVRFVDGKDVGETIAWIRSPAGQPVPIRLSQIGSISMRVENGVCRREFDIVERVVSMAVDLFPWTEVESFAAALQENGFRLLPARPPNPPKGDFSKGDPSYDFEKMRKVANNRSNTEMEVLEEAALAVSAREPTIVDGRLSPRTGGFDKDRSPVFGVIKTQRQKYLHTQGMQVLYQLDIGQRTPAFTISRGRLPVVSWYIRLSGGGGATPSWGIVRVEASQSWFEARGRYDWDFVDQLSRTIYEYRCRERSYDRAAVSLHPIVRSEESLGSLFAPLSILTNRFYRLTQL